MVLTRLILALVAIAACLTARAEGQETSQYRLHFTGVSCVVSPCPQWQATEMRSGARFAAVVDFSAVGGQPKISALDDVLASASRKLVAPPNGLTYDLLVVVSIGGAPTRAQMR